MAFIGIDGKDGNGSAAAFLRRFPVSYPSYTDPGESIARAYQAATYYPQTLFFDRPGHASTFTTTPARTRARARSSATSGAMP